MTNNTNTSKMQFNIWATLGAIGIILTVCLLYYFWLPPVNLRSGQFWLFMTITFGLVGIIPAMFQMYGKAVIVWILTGAIALLGLICWFISLPMFFHAEEYASLLETTPADMTTYDVPVENAPVIDELSANSLAQKNMGELVDQVSQFEAGMTTQMEYKGSAVRVAPLRYAGFWQYQANRSNGIPGYIQIDMKTQETKLVKVDGGIKYAPSAYFWHDLTRHFRMKYPSAIVADCGYELDDNGKPWWIISVEKRMIGVMGGSDVDYIIIMDPATGEGTEYAPDKVPNWVDRSYSVAMIHRQFNWKNKYAKGWWNSVTNKEGSMEASDGYNYVIIDGDQYVYSGVTSVTSDSSNIGFLLTNQRTKETVQYNYPGAIEAAAMGAAEGLVQQYGYQATFPLLISVTEEPTYFMSLKDKHGTIRQYAMVNVSDYQNMAVAGDTIEGCKKAYTEKLKLKGKAKLNSGEPAEVKPITGDIQLIEKADIGGNTYFYVLLESGLFYKLSMQNEDVVQLLPGKSVTLIPGDPVTDTIYNAVLQ